LEGLRALSTAAGAGGDVAGGGRRVPGAGVCEGRRPGGRGAGGAGVLPKNRSRCY